MGSILGWLSEVLKSILYRYKNTGLLGQVLDPLFADKQISVTLYTQEEHKRISSWLIIFFKWLVKKISLFIKKWLILDKLPTHFIGSSTVLVGK